MNEERKNTKWQLEIEIHLARKIYKHDINVLKVWDVMLHEQAPQWGWKEPKTGDIRSSWGCTPLSFGLSIRDGQES